MLGGQLQRGQCAAGGRTRVRCVGRRVVCALPRVFLHKVNFRCAGADLGQQLLVLLGKASQKFLIVGQHGVGRAAAAAKQPQRVKVAQRDVAPGAGGVKVQRRAQIPVAAHDARRQAGGVGAYNADAVHIDAEQLRCAHFCGQIQRHIVAPAAVNVLYTVNFPRAQGREAGTGRQHIVL